MNIKEIAHKLRNKLKIYDDFQGLYLYGSRIKGTAKPDSDVDVIMIFKKPLSYKESRQVAGLVCDIEYLNNIFIDYHPMTLNELSLNPLFYEEITNNGIYYEAI